MADQLVRLGLQCEALLKKVRQTQNPARQRQLLHELIGVAYARELAMLPTSAVQPGHKERQRVLAARRAGMDHQYAAVLERYAGAATQPATHAPQPDDHRTSTAAAVLS